MFSITRNRNALVATAVIFTVIGYGTYTTTRDKNSMKQITLPSGLSYEITKEGKADSATAHKNKMVTVHYTGWLSENGNPGRKFDSSVDRKEPFSFTLGVGYVIKGWDEGVEGMKIGEKRRITIPSALGYGQRGVPGLIPAGSTLIFDVELIDVK